MMSPYVTRGMLIGYRPLEPKRAVRQAVSATARAPRRAGTGLWALLRRLFRSG